MHPKIQELCNILDDLSDSIIKLTNDDRFASEINGWNYPSVNRHGLAFIPKNLSEKLKKYPNLYVDEDFTEVVEEIKKIINQFRQKTLAHLPNGSTEAISAFTTTMGVITSMLEPLWSWEVLNDNNALPRGLASRLRSIESSLNEVSPKKEDLIQWIRLIIEGKETAISLPTDLEMLKESRNKVEKFTNDSAGNVAKIEDYLNKSASTYQKLIENEENSKKIVDKCNEAYRITTSVGLAASFDERAKSTSTTLWVWVGGLLIALGAGSFFGSQRIELLSKVMEKANPQWTVVWMHIILSVLSIGAPLWFAWLSTKQINQRFRLSEDYAFKASVAKAYEGYRREAANLDPIFEARLFSSALSRLEEAPLRLVEGDTHGSPWHELFSSPAFQKAIYTFPELKDELVKIAKQGIDVFSKKSNIPSSVEEEAA
ncbi:hypothetical protein [Emticicia sp. 21SJ11W-3]|uniref:hypothetical protein n=1 Tax=Emticicia sp. 21SJ11W-3 TaxID=2916755 RepID=UPI0020A20C24|nr:hypothetical protein [Emticicia sp. 21SJ11W-3]UTA69615.1 hypothetical protein MB380_07345 [Emticicia sp. 21SJ11W-3]